LAKIHKSTAVIIDTNKPVIIDRPQLGYGLRQSVKESACRMRQKSGSDRQANTSQARLEAQQQQLSLEAERIIEEAQAKVKDLLAQADQEAFQIKQQAYAEAMAKAEQEKKDWQNKQKMKLDSQLEVIATQMKAEQDQFIKQSEPELLKLSLAIAEKIICCELIEREQTYRSLLRQIMASLRPDETMTIYVNEQDYWHSLAGQSQEQTNDLQPVKMIKDNKLPRGSCRIEGSFGQIDAGIQAQIRSIRQQLQLES